MTDHPIIFSAPMIRALLDGRKTMTRRLAVNEPSLHQPNPKPSPWRSAKPGDHLYARENFSGPYRLCDVKPKDWPVGTPVWYWADGNPEYGDWTKLKPSIHLPRKFSRLTLVVTATKIEPLLDISEADAAAEGFEPGKIDDGFGPRDFGGGYTIESPGGYASAAGHFQILWTKLHPEWDGFSSPDVVAISFKVIKGNIDAMSKDGAA